MDWLLLVSWDKRRDSPSQLIHVFHHLVEYRLSVGQLATERYELFGDSPRDSILRCVITQVCSCPPGYEGDPYTGCTQDPCNPSPCGENGICERNGKIFLLQHDFFISLHLWLAWTTLMIATYNYYFISYVSCFFLFFFSPLYCPLCTVTCDHVTVISAWCCMMSCRRCHTQCCHHWCKNLK